MNDFTSTGRKSGIQEVIVLRRQLIANGYTPIPLLTRDKKTLVEGWQTKHSIDPEWCLRENGSYGNTGILTQGLCLIDSDIDDADLSKQIRSVANEMLDPTLVRIRSNSPRFAMLYRGSIRPVTVGDADGRKLQILSGSTQFLAYGMHPSGVSVEWEHDNGPHECSIAGLSLIDPDRLLAFLDVVCDILKSEWKHRVVVKPKSNGDIEFLPWTIDDIRLALTLIPNDDLDYDDWLKVAYAVWSAAPDDEKDDAFEAWNEWSATSSKYNEGTTHKVWRGIDKVPPREITAGTLVHYVLEATGNDKWFPPSWSDFGDGLGPEPHDPFGVCDEKEDAANGADESKADTESEKTDRSAKANSSGDTGAVTKGNGFKRDDFWAYLPDHKYIYAPTNMLWTTEGVNAALPRIPLVDAVGCPVLDGHGKQKTVLATTWLDRAKRIAQMTWVPGQPMILKDQLFNEGGRVAHPGVNCFNLFREPPILNGGNPRQAVRWIRLLRKVFPGISEARHILLWLAHRVQKPDEKPNHGLVFSGAPGIGKDTLIQPLIEALGSWNCQEIKPSDIVRPTFNGFARCLLLRISEAHDLGEVSRFAFYEASKIYLAAPPDMLRVNDKYLRAFYIMNCCGVIITTNHKIGGIYLSGDDRRHFVAHSPREQQDFPLDFWSGFWNWYLKEDGIAHVVAYLRQVNISGFNAKAPPPKTPAFWDIVGSNQAPEENELSDLLDHLGNPNAVTLGQLIEANNVFNRGSFDTWLADRKNRRVVPHRMEGCGYSSVRNPDAKDGLWKIKGRRQAIYAKKELTLHDQIMAAKGLI
jgi:hypothetical protein